MNARTRVAVGGYKVHGVEAILETGSGVACRRQYGIKGKGTETTGQYGIKGKGTEATSCKPQARRDS